MTFVNLKSITIFQYLIHRDLQIISAVKSAPGTDKKTDLFSLIHATEFENLSVLCSGSIPPNPAEILGSEPMAEFLEEIGEDFNYIIIDTPPINVVSDALPVIRESDGVVLVVRSNQSTHPEIQRAISALEFIDAKILGFVVNFADSNRTKYGYANTVAIVTENIKRLRLRSYGNYGSYNGYGYGYESGGYGYGYGGYGGYGYGYGSQNNYASYGNDSAPYDARQNKR